MSDDRLPSELPGRAPVAVWRTSDRGLAVTTAGRPILVVRRGFGDDFLPRHLNTWDAWILSPGMRDTRPLGFASDAELELSGTAGGPVTANMVTCRPRQENGTEIVVRQGVARALYSVVFAKGVKIAPSQAMRQAGAELWRRLDPTVLMREAGEVWRPCGSDPSLMPAGWKPASSMVFDNFDALKGDEFKRAFDRIVQDVATATAGWRARWEQTWRTLDQPPSTPGPSL